MTPTSTGRRGRPPGGGRTPVEARAALVDAALAVFLRDGVARVTVGRLTAEAGVTRSIFYRHFASRDEVLEAVLSRLADLYVAQLADRLDPDQRLADYIVEAMADLVELVRSDPNLVAVFADDSRAAAGRVVGGSNALRSQSRAFIDRVLADASPEQLAQLRPGLDRDRIADHLILVGLALIQGFGRTSDDPIALRTYLREFVVPPLVGAG